MNPNQYSYPIGPQLPQVAPGQNPNAAVSTNVPANNPNLANNLDPSAIQAQIEQNAKDTGTWGQAQTNSIYQQYSPATDTTINALRSAQAEQIKQLFAHDSHLAAVYGGVNNSPGFQQDPNHPVWMPPNNQAVIDPMIGSTAATNQQIAQGNDVANMGLQIGQRKDILTTAQDKALAGLQMGLQAKQLEAEALKSALNTALTKQQTMLQLLGLTGGTVPSSISSYLGTSPGAVIPSELTKALAVASVPYTMNPEYQPIPENQLTAIRNLPGGESIPAGITPAAFKTIYEPLIAAQIQRQALVGTSPTMVKTSGGPDAIGDFWKQMQGRITGQETTTPVFQGGGSMGLTNPGADNLIMKTPAGTTVSVQKSHLKDALNMGYTAQ